MTKASRLALAGLLGVLLLASEAPAPAPLCNEASGLSEAEAARFAARARLFERELGLRFGLAAGHWPDLSARRSAQSFDALAVAADGRGALLMIDREAGRSRLEVGYGLEALITDALAGRWLDEHLQPRISRQGADVPAWQLIRMAQDRARRAAFEGRPMGASLPEGSGGAGASASGGPAQRSAAARPPRVKHAPARSPEEAYEQYIAWLSASSPELPASLFSEASLQLLERWSPGRAYREHALWREAGRRFAFAKRGERAMAYALDDPFLPPHFFARHGSSWQMELAYEAEHVIGIAGGRYSWSLHPALADPGAPFRDELVWVDGVLRVSQGDNRPLPEASASARAANATRRNPACDRLRS